MTESGWQTSADLWEMLRYVEPHCGARKLLGQVTSGRRGTRKTDAH
jgi:hypothetical protein